MFESETRESVFGLLVRLGRSHFYFSSKIQTGHENTIFNYTLLLNLLKLVKLTSFNASVN